MDSRAYDPISDERLGGKSPSHPTRLYFLSHLHITEEKYLNSASLVQPASVVHLPRS